MQLSLPGYVQTYVAGRLSKTYNSLSETYYSYDAHGRVLFTVQKSNSLAYTGAVGANPSYKTIDYKFSNLSGRLNEIVYQKGKQDEFHHYYTYDADGRLNNAKISRLDQTPANQLQLASYDYYLHGPLKNVSLGDHIQDVDYVYNINGMLKAINNPIPKSGGLLYPNEETPASGFSKDVFAEVINYFHGDYSRTNVGLDVAAKTTPQSGTAAFNATVDLFSGNISSVVTNTAFDQSSIPSPKPQNLMIQSYKYDVLQRLTNVFAETADAASFVNWNATVATGEPYKSLMIYDANGNIIALRRNTMGRTSGGGVTFVDANNTPVIMTSPTTDMDIMGYHYTQTTTDFYGATKKTNNQLNYVTDVALHEVGLDDIQSQSLNNYTYDSKGRIVSDIKNGITNIQWTSYDKVKQVTFDAAHDSKIIAYEYNPQHLRLTKFVQFPSHTNDNIITTYMYDGTGLLMATYDYYYAASAWKYRLNELETYAAGRTGVYDLNEDLVNATPPANDPIRLRFEISDHLGSVRAVVSGVKNTNGNADIISLTDYHEFGMTMRGRSFVSATTYRYGYQGSEKETGIAGTYTTDFRMLDVRIGRWFMPDPIFDPSVSPYASMGNNPVFFNDLFGLSTGDGGGDAVNVQDACEAIPAFGGSDASGGSGSSNNNTSFMDFTSFFGNMNSSNSVIADGGSAANPSLSSSAQAQNEKGSVSNEDGGSKLNSSPDNMGQEGFDWGWANPTTGKYVIDHGNNIKGKEYFYDKDIMPWQGGAYYWRRKDDFARRTDIKKLLPIKVTEVPIDPNEPSLVQKIFTPARIRISNARIKFGSSSTNLIYDNETYQTLTNLARLMNNTGAIMTINLYTARSNTDKNKDFLRARFTSILMALVNGFCVEQTKILRGMLDDPNFLDPQSFKLPNGNRTEIRIRYIK